VNEKNILNTGELKFTAGIFLGGIDPSTLYRE
jgi:hypothetical protein